MHEFGLCEAVVGAVERRAQGRRVTEARVGMLHRVVEPALDQAFAMSATGAGAVPVHKPRHPCGQETEPKDPLTARSQCSNDDLGTSRGDKHLFLESIRFVDRTR